MKKTYMLDTNICSFIIRKKPGTLLKVLQGHVENRDKLVISAITYAELRFGSIEKKSSPKHVTLVDDFMARPIEVLAWDKDAVDATTALKQALAEQGTPIGANDSAIAGHALSVDCVVVTNNRREFDRVPNLEVEDWTV